MWDAIKKSRNTTFERFVITMDIPIIGNTASRILARQFYSNLDAFTNAVENIYDFRQIPDFGEILHNNIYHWFWNEENCCMWFEMRELFAIQKPDAVTQPVPENPFIGKTIVVTGTVEPYI